MKTRRERFEERFPARFWNFSAGANELVLSFIDEECRLAIEGERERIVKNLNEFAEEMEATLSPNPKAK